MTQEYINTEKILEQLNGLRKKIDEIEIAVAKENGNEIRKRPLAKEFFGRLKGQFKRSAQELKDEAREGWD